MTRIGPRDIGALCAIGTEHRHQHERTHGRRHYGISPTAATPWLRLRYFIVHRDRLILALLLPFGWIRIHEMDRLPGHDR
jgi:hypothetical protein